MRVGRDARNVAHRRVELRDRHARRRDAEDGDAGTDRVEEGLATEDGGAVRRMADRGPDPVGRERAGRLLEARELVAGEPVIGLGAREVGHEALDPDLWRDAVRERGEVRRTHAEARHPRVDLEVRIDRSADRAGRAGEALEVRGVVDDGDEVTRDDLLVRAAVVPAHDEDRRADARIAELHRLLEQRDAEALGAGALERTRHRGRTVTVAVGLEDRPDLRSPRMARDHAHVVAERGQVHLRARRTDRVGRRSAPRPEDTHTVGTVAAAPARLVVPLIVVAGGQ